MNLQEMIYQENRIPPVRLADGVYRGVPFYVLSLGTHPCAYVDIAPLGLHAINERDIDCHGGITYHHDYLARLTTKEISWGGITHIVWTIPEVSHSWISATVRGGQPQRW
jgi:hypothetical protein